jgi:NADPH-dependent 2,4-dienoyl-CoA reductase/sulfur reductase-like enzyme
MTAADHIQETAGSVPVVRRSDVVVVGGGPAGFAAAVAARR